MTSYADNPGLMYYKGSLFVCPCGVSEFKVEIGPDPVRYWCSCGKMYTEEIVNALFEEASGGQ